MNVIRLLNRIPVMGGKPPPLEPLFWVIDMGYMLYGFLLYFLLIAKKKKKKKLEVKGPR